MNAAFLPEKMRAITVLVCVPLLASSLSGKNTTTVRYVVNGQSITIAIDHDAPGKRPSTPDNLTASAQDQTGFSLSWSPSEPASNSSILFYEIFRNGTSFATAVEPQVSIPYEATGARLEFFSVRAVDSRGRISRFSPEILAPRAESSVTLEKKIAGAVRAKRGFVGLLDPTTFFTTVEYAHSESVFWSGIENSTYDDSLSYWRSFDPVTGLWSTSVSGQHAESNYSIPGVTIPTTPYTYDSNTDSIFLGDAPNRIFPELDYYAQEFALIEEKTNTEVLRAFESVNGSDRHTLSEQVTLSGEYTDSDLRNGVNADLELALPHLASLNWNEEFTVSYRNPIEPWSLLLGNFGRYTSASFDPEGRVVIPEERAGAGEYRYKVEAGAGSLALRWAEVFVPPRGGRANPMVLATREELVSATFEPAYTSAVAVAAPDDFGTIEPVLLPPMAEIVPLPALGAGLKFYIPDAMSVEQTAEIKLAKDPNPTIAGSMIVTVSGAENAIQLVLIDRAVEDSMGLAAAIAQGEVISSGTDLASLPGSPGLPQGQFRLLAVGMNPGSAVIRIQFLNSPEASVTRTLTVYPPASLAVDANHDGEIIVGSVDNPDAISSTAPFRFWVNDDDDSGEEKSGSLDDLPLSLATSGRNAGDDHVNGIRDLVDFFPVCLDVKQLLTDLPPDTNGVSYYLKQEDSALGIVFTSYTRAQVFDYLRGTPSSLDTGFGPNLTQKAGEAMVTKITAAGVNLFATSPAFQARIQNNDGGVILIEASKATVKPLILEVHKGTDVIATVQLALKIDPVDTMFRYYNVRSQAHGTAIAADNQGPNYGAGTPSDAPNDPFQNVANRKNAVFVHGYNVNSQQAQGSAAEMFKRLYWGGSKAKFYAVLWRGDDGQGKGIVPAGVTPDYHRNVGHAWQQGPYLRDLLTSLTGDTAVIAHSLGNMVTQVALTYDRDPANAARLRPATRPAGVKNYFAIDAALPLEAVRGTAVTANSKALMRHPGWAEYDTQERLWPTQWYALFTGTSDGRNGLTWQNVFAGLDVGTNLYSSGEEVLANPINDSVPLWEPLFGSGLRAWVSQEKHKGGAGLAAPFFRSRTGGWIENKAWYVPTVPTPPAGSPQTHRRFASEAQDVAAPGGVPTSALASEPFFQRFQASESGGFYPGYQGSRLHAPIGDANADDEARKLVTVAKCLGEAIPALSFPLGSNNSTKFDDLSGNFDLNGAAFKNGWPSSRSDTNWKHSDCLNVAYIFNFPLYDKMTSDGDLK